MFGNDVGNGSLVERLRPLAARYAETQGGGVMDAIRFYASVTDGLSGTEGTGTVLGHAGDALCHRLVEAFQASCPGAGTEAVVGFYQAVRPFAALADGGLAVGGEDAAEPLRAAAPAAKRPSKVAALPEAKEPAQVQAPAFEDDGGAPSLSGLSLQQAIRSRYPEIDWEHPKVPVNQTVPEEGELVVCLIDGKSTTMLKRYLHRWNISFEDYAVGFGLPPGTRPVHPNYSKRKRAEAEKVGLGSRANKQGVNLSKEQARVAA